LLLIPIQDKFFPNLQNSSTLLNDTFLRYITKSPGLINIIEVRKDLCNIAMGRKMALLSLLFALNSISLQQSFETLKTKAERGRQMVSKSLPIDRTSLCN